MNDPQVSSPVSSQEEHADMMSALFAQLVLQQSNLAMMLLGRTPHPESGQVVRDIEGAKLFIDQLEMLESKTKGNLSKEESTLLKQSLMALRLAFVECVNAAPPTSGAEAEGGVPPTESGAAAGSTPASPPPEAPASDEASRKKFTKKY
jgi:hypothetical protein